MVTDLTEFTLIAAVALGGALLLLLLMRALEARPAMNTPQLAVGSVGPVFLFKDGHLRDATPDAMALIAPVLDHMEPWDAMLHVLGQHFDNLADALADTTGRIIGQKSAIWIDVSREHDQLRLTINGTRSNGFADNDMMSRDIRMTELMMMRDLTQHTPQLIWQEDLTGRLLWANHAYLSFCDKLRGEDETTATWPSNPILPDLHENAIGTTPSLRRVSVTLPDAQAEQWFDVTSVRREDCLLHFANDANAIVRADQERRNFVQTLTKTFAQLSIGLAIFDKRRQLAMFNPALLDMTNLPIEFLSARPTVDAVLDRLRESRMLPEPKDYTTWREQFTALEQAAKNGSYSETWNLPDGQTYRVTGRPHPDGAIAFLFEDISAEMSLTRRFRSDIETAQAVFDTLSDPIAVFSSSGTMMMSNKAYGDLWGQVADDCIQQHEIQSAIRIWQSRCTPTQMWSDLRAFVHMVGPRKPWSETAILDDGRRIDCLANPLAGGMTMVKFSLPVAAHPVIHKLTQPDPLIVAAKR